MVIDPLTKRRLVYGGRKHRYWISRDYVMPDARKGEMVLEPDPCRRLAIEPWRNPFTKRRMDAHGPTAGRLRSRCAHDGYACLMWEAAPNTNPTTNRKMKPLGRKWRSMLRTCANQNACAALRVSLKTAQPVNPRSGRPLSQGTRRSLINGCSVGQAFGRKSAKPVRTRCGNTNAARTIGFGLAVRQSTIPGAGRGLFATQWFRKGDTITEYDGEIINRDEAERRRNKNLHSHIRSLASGRVAVDGRLVPATWGHGGGSFINDVRDRFLYNATFCNTDAVLAGVRRKGPKVMERTFVRATKDIAPGQEIFAPYGKGYWKTK